ncbi:MULTISPECIES: methyl-accepting chemotaxis protein [unclassified Virgibacillus]|uniref:methyl-accepting chemotaxis protein n=1 Tax=unclassified Virgibacillus TaxID=2620237 RepID=UPI0024DEE8DB|nr:methyl-accepting chemotaxis protein [Virgibacillus sp. LDC-1]
MKKLFNFKHIRTKILFGFAFVMLLVFAISATNYFAMKGTNIAIKQVIEEELELLTANQNMTQSMLGRIAAARGYILTGSIEHKKAFSEYTELGLENEEIIREINDSDEFDQLIEKTVEWRKIVTDDIFVDYDLGNKDKAYQKLVATMEQTAEIINGYEKLTQESHERIEQIGNETIQSGETARITSLVFSNLTTVFIITIALLTARMVSKPVIKVTKRMSQIASGELNHEALETTSVDEIGQLTRATNEMNAKMRDILTSISNVSNTVAAHSEELTQSANEVMHGTEQVATTMQELATGSETQANSASDVASIMGTFASTVKETNENGEQIKQYADEVIEMTSEGSDLMNASTNQMKRIDHMVRDTVTKVEGLDAQSQEISNLVSVINDIADQTNLLALNAAIEAARAGEQGRGFAVVADEVRKLAEQVSLSVTDISGIVERIQQETNLVTTSLKEGYKEVEQGSEQIESTGVTFGKISSAVSNMAESITFVSENLANIAENTEKINHSIDEIASVSEESAAGVEETAATVQQASSSMQEVAGSSDQLAKQAEQLNELVGRFKL